MGSSPAMTKIFCANFFRLCETFFANISKGSTLHFFCLFCKRMDVEKLPKGPILHVSALCDLRETKKIWKKIQKNRNFFSIFPQTGTVEENTWHFEVLLLFLSLRYGADLGRSRLVNIWSRCYDTTEQLMVSNYHVHTKVTSVNGKSCYFPPEFHMRKENIWIKQVFFHKICQAPNLYSTSRVLPTEFNSH